MTAGIFIEKRIKVKRILLAIFLYDRAENVHQFGGFREKGDNIL